MWVKRLLRRLLDDGSEQPGECDPELYKKGEAIAIITGGCSQAIEALVRRVGSELNGKARVDWHYIVDHRAALREILNVAETGPVHPEDHEPSAFEDAEALDQIAEIAHKALKE